MKSSFNTDLSDVSHVFDVDGAAAVKVPGLQVALHVLCRWLEKLLLAVLLLALVPSMGMKICTVTVGYCENHLLRQSSHKATGPYGAKIMFAICYSGVTISDNH